MTNKPSTSDNSLNTSQIMGLDSRHLQQIDAQHSLLPKVIKHFKEMQQAAKRDGVDLQICSSFRDFNKQLSIWNRKWRGELPLLTLDDQVIEPNSLSDVDKIHAIMLWSALPGASRHHWGSDFDVFDQTQVQKRAHNFQLVPSEYEGEGPCAALYSWLHENSATFGFYLPYEHYVGGVAREPWHLSFKDIAEQIIQQFSINDLYAQIEQADILGKDEILKRLPELVHQYTFNQGNK